MVFALLRSCNNIDLPARVDITMMQAGRLQAEMQYRCRELKLRCYCSQVGGIVQIVSDCLFEVESFTCAPLPVHTLHRLELLCLTFLPSYAKPGLLHMGRAYDRAQI